ncbi:pyrimidine reductase family protein [Subtercola boreus]|uniref:pyrimidine reductase family protein n=1 Tax=Subtercola boreus TaxID=120213 RepID=UPI00209BFD88|nr:pyrimidine reductase family protein [Subtercola boreus]
MTHGIISLYPTARHPAGAPDALTDAELLSAYSVADRSATLVRANVVASLDGSATASGLSGALGAPSDKRVFDLLRQLCDVVIVGAGTVRSEGYGALRLAPEAVAWRLANGLPEHPVFAVVSGRLDLDPANDLFAAAPVRPLVLTARTAPASRRATLSEVSEVVDCGETRVEALRLVAALVERGLSQIHCEGGPTLLGTLVAADLLDELCLTTSPTLEGGVGPRISHAAASIPLQPMHLEHVLLAGSMLLSRYSRQRSSSEGQSGSGLRPAAAG